MNKSKIREQMKDKRNCLSRDEIITKSNQIFQTIEKIDFFSSVKDILIYVSYKSEVDTHEFIKKCLYLRKNVFVPKVYGNIMQFIQIENFYDLKKGTYGILEPVKDIPVWNDSRWTTKSLSKALIILPALALDMQFNRVGYGGGYYDKYLSLHNSIIKIAVSFDFQVVHQIDNEKTDKKVDIIVTEQRVFTRKNN